MRGIGETFAPDLHTGTGNFTVPLVLPPGRNGFQPDIELVYSTGHGNGPFGLGWSLSIPGIARKTTRGVPRYDGGDVDLYDWMSDVPANPFDYRTIADVLLTVDYTALDSLGYRQQVQQALPPTIAAERAFSFQQEFADAWYDLHNPDQTAEPMTVRFTTTRDDFPPNLTNLRIQHLALYVARANGQRIELPVTALRFAEADAGGQVGGGGLTLDGLISTRQGNAGGWAAIQGKEPIGRWELVLPNTAEVIGQFAAEHITDLLLVITYVGRTPTWPR
jgi:hypothetical protein